MCHSTLYFLHHPDYQMTMIRRLIVIVFLTVAIVLGYFYLTSPESLNLAQHSQSHGEAAIGGPFTLTDHHGKPFTEAQLQGKLSLVFFGFTRCPDICPTTLLAISNALGRMSKEEADSVQPVFISVDAERDTPETMALYVSNFHKNLVGLTGTLEQIHTVANAYKVYFSKVEQKGSAMDYLMDHSGFIFLMDKQGKYVAHFPHDVAEQTLLDSLRRAMHPE